MDSEKRDVLPGHVLPWHLPEGYVLGKGELVPCLREYGPLSTMDFVANAHPVAFRLALVALSLAAGVGVALGVSCALLG